MNVNGPVLRAGKVQLPGIGVLRVRPVRLSIGLCRHVFLIRLGICDGHITVGSSRLKFRLDWSRGIFLLLDQQFSADKLSAVAVSRDNHADIFPNMFCAGGEYSGGAKIIRIPITIFLILPVVMDVFACNRAHRTTEYRCDRHTHGNFGGIGICDRAGEGQGVFDRHFFCKTCAMISWYCDPCTNRITQIARGDRIGASGSAGDFCPRI